MIDDGDDSTAEGSWEEFLDLARSSAQPLRNELLVTLCLAADLIILASDHSKLGLSESRPAAVLVREAAQLLDLDESDPVTRVVALTFRYWRIARSDENDLLARDAALEAKERAIEAGDPLLASWSLRVFSDHLHRTRRVAESLVWAEDSLRVRRLAVARPGRGPSAAASAHILPWDNDENYQTVMDFFLHSALAKSYRGVGDLANWKMTLETVQQLGRAALDFRPSMYGLAFTRNFELERQLGGQADLSELEELREQSFSLGTTYLIQAAANASHLGDYKRVISIQTERVHRVLSKLGADYAGFGIADTTVLIRPRSENIRRRLVSVGNGAYEIASALISSGTALTTEDGRNTALLWLDLAEAIWNPWGTNGIQAIRFQRAKLQADSDPIVARDMMIDVSQKANRPGLRVNSICYAATRLPVDHDSLTAPVLLQLDSMLEEKWDQVDQAQLFAARAWITAVGRASQRKASETDAREAFELLSSRPVSGREALAQASWVLAQWARRRGDSATELSSLREAILAIGRMLLNATTSDQRRFLAERWAPLFVDTLTTAVREGNHDLVDLAGEIIRRDGIGVLLASVIDDDDISDDIRTAVSDTIAAENADLESLSITDTARKEPDARTESDTGKEQNGGGAATNLMRSAGMQIIGDRVRNAHAAVEKLIGPLGSLSNPETLFSALSREILQTRGPRDQATYLLQLVPSSVPLLATMDTPQVFRRLSWIDRDGVFGDFTDLVAIDSALLHDSSNDDARIGIDATDLIPPILKQALDTAPTNDPIRLMVVATGFFHLHWDGLRVDNRPLLDAAIVSLHTSLTGMRHQLAETPRDIVPGSVAVVDHARLPASSAELRALTALFPSVQDARTREGLETLRIRGQTASVLAVSVHGSDDEEGWGQYKLLPSGEYLTAAEALSFWYPAVCVLASCHSRVRTAKGMDLAGFPTAMFARGAQTIIGSVGEIPDIDTAQILVYFYSFLHQHGDPIRALRDARIAWIDEDPRRWRSPRMWCRLVAYGGVRH